MYDSFTAQLAGLDLAGFSVQPAPFNETDFPAEEASEQTLAAVWSDMVLCRRLFRRCDLLSGRGRTSIPSA